MNQRTNPLRSHEHNHARRTACNTPDTTHIYTNLTDPVDWLPLA